MGLGSVATESGEIFHFLTADLANWGGLLVDQNLDGFAPSDGVQRFFVIGAHLFRDFLFTSV